MKKIALVLALMALMGFNTAASFAASDSEPPQTSTTSENAALSAMDDSAQSNELRTDDLVSIDGSGGYGDDSAAVVAIKSKTKTA